MSERCFAICVSGSADDVTTGLAKRSELRAWLRSAFYPETQEPVGAAAVKEEAARWKHVSSRANWQLTCTDGPAFYEYYDGECTVRIICVGEMLP